MKNLFNKYYIIFFYLCANFVLFAQPGIGNDTNDLENADAPAAPINDYIWVLALAGLIFIFLKLRTTRSKKIQFLNLPFVIDPKMSRY
jgi:membrane protease YdiL (CAAX protease family)